MESHIILTDPLPEEFTKRMEARYQLRYFESATDSDFKACTGMVIYGHQHIDGAVMDRSPNLRVISNHGVGVDHINLDAAAQRGIPVGNTPGCLDESTADMTLALILSTARNIVVGDQFARGPDFTHYDPSLWIGQEVSGSTLGIVGMGRIGTEVARRAKAFNMTVLYCNRNRRESIERELGVQYTQLDDLLSQSDFVSLNCPLTEETTGLIGADQLRQMKNTAILVNVARGPVVDTQALYDALSGGVIRAAGLDVTDPEPLPRNHPLLTLDNVVIAPHLGSATKRTRDRMMELSIANLEAGLAGEPLPASPQS